MHVRFHSFCHWYEMMQSQAKPLTSAPPRWWRRATSQLPHHSDHNLTASPLARGWVGRKTRGGWRDNGRKGGRDGGWIITLECCLQWACSGSIAQRTTKRCVETWSLAVFWSSQQQHFRWVYFNDKNGANGILMLSVDRCTYIETEWHHRQNE